MAFGGPRPFPSDYRELFNKILFLAGILIIIYAILWILAELNLIPVIIFVLFPQFVLLLIGIFIVYQAWNRRNMY